MSKDQGAAESLGLSIPPLNLDRDPLPVHVMEASQTVVDEGAGSARPFWEEMLRSRALSFPSFSRSTAAARDAWRSAFGVAIYEAAAIVRAEPLNVECQQNRLRRPLVA